MKLSSILCHSQLSNKYNTNNKYKTKLWYITILRLTSFIICKPEHKGSPLILCEMLKNNLVLQYYNFGTKSCT